MGPAARAHLRQDVPAHLRGVPRARPAAARGGVPPALRAALDAGPDAVRAGHGRPAPAPAPAAATADRARSSSSLFGVVPLLGALYLLGRRRGATRRTRTRSPNTVATATADGDARRASPRKSQAQEEEGGADARHAAADRHRRACYVCLVDATGKQVVDGDYLEAGKSTRVVPLAALPRELRQRRRAHDASSGKRYRAADVGAPIGYEFRPGQEARAALGVGARGALRT